MEEKNGLDDDFEFDDIIPEKEPVQPIPIQVELESEELEGSSVVKIPVQEYIRIPIAGVTPPDEVDIPVTVVSRPWRKIWPKVLGGVLLPTLVFVLVGLSLTIFNISTVRIAIAAVAAISYTIAMLISHQYARNIGKMVIAIAGGFLTIIALSLIFPLALVIAILIAVFLSLIFLKFRRKALIWSVGILAIAVVTALFTTEQVPLPVIDLSFLPDWRDVFVYVFITCSLVLMFKEGLWVLKTLVFIGIIISAGLLGARDSTFGMDYVTNGTPMVIAAGLWGLPLFFFHWIKKNGAGCLALILAMVAIPAVCVLGIAQLQRMDGLPASQSIVVTATQVESEAAQEDSRDDEQTEEPAKTSEPRATNTPEPPACRQVTSDVPASIFEQMDGQEMFGEEIDTGTRVVIIDESNPGWSQVRLGNGKKVWMMIAQLSENTVRCQ